MNRGRAWRRIICSLLVNAMMPRQEHRWKLVKENWLFLEHQKNCLYIINEILPNENDTHSVNLAEDHEYLIGNCDASGKCC